MFTCRRTGLRMLKRGARIMQAVNEQSLIVGALQRVKGAFEGLEISGG